MTALLLNGLTFVCCEVHSKSHINHLLEMQPSEDMVHPSGSRKLSAVSYKQFCCVPDWRSMYSASFLQELLAADVYRTE